MNRIEECMDFVKRWYLGEMITTVIMDGSDPATELCIQSMVVALLRDFIDHPIPEGMLEGSQQMNEWIDFAFRKVMQGLDFGFTVEQEDAVKNLAFNYWIDGVRKVQAQPELRNRLFQCCRGQTQRSA